MTAKIKTSFFVREMDKIAPIPAYKLIKLPRIRGIVASPGNPIHFMVGVNAWDKFLMTVVY
ncbi:hypothetical protein JIR001_08200 [Polycladomyces abyssicola]|uniref:Uncharacterized protein n=1 Tax=Polycladomyces abyssicola TaxID=1125966 RepID=A0A8D5UFG8_9BACL|nr:hypothetical protein JIR001_08200 [Polycladomyces abyssicola]